MWMYFPGFIGCYPPLWYFYFGFLSCFVTVLTGYIRILLIIIAYHCIYCCLMLWWVTALWWLTASDVGCFCLFVVDMIHQYWLVVGMMSGFQAGRESCTAREEGLQLPKWSWGFRGSEWIRGGFDQFLVEKHGNAFSWIHRVLPPLLAE